MKTSLQIVWFAIVGLLVYTLGLVNGAEYEKESWLAFSKIQWCTKDITVTFKKE